MKSPISKKGLPSAQAPSMFHCATAGRSSCDAMKSPISKKGLPSAQAPSMLDLCDNFNVYSKQKLRKFHSVIPTRDTKWPWSLCHGSWNTRPSQSKPVQSQFHSVIPARDTKWPWSLCHGSWNTRPSRSKPVQSQCVQTSQVQTDNVRLAVSSDI